MHGVRHCVGLFFPLYPLRCIGLHLHYIQGDPVKTVTPKQKMFRVSLSIKHKGVFVKFVGSHTQSTMYPFRSTGLDSKLLNAFWKSKIPHRVKRQYLIPYELLTYILTYLLNYFTYLLTP